MSNSSQFLGGTRRVTALLNNPQPAQYLYASPTTALASGVAVGALTANTLKTALSITGRGQINWLAVTEAAVTSPTNRIKITLDGTVILDKTGVCPNGYGLMAIGSALSQTSGDWIIQFQPITFDVSFLVEVASTLASSTQTLYYNGETHA